MFIEIYLLTFIDILIFYYASIIFFEINKIKTTNLLQVFIL